MQHEVRNPGQAVQTRGLVEVISTGTAPRRLSGSRSASRRTTAKTRKRREPRQRTTRDISAANNQNTFHRQIISRRSTMSFRVSIQPGGQQFEAAEDTTILQAALDAGYLLPYGCRDGACGACKGRILEGSVDYGKASPNTLTEAEKDAGLALFCCATPRTDLLLECKQITHSSDIPVKETAVPGAATREGRQRRHDPRGKTLPASEKFQFRAGQYIDFLLSGNRRRSFSIANSPHGADHLELHIRHIDGGAFTGQVFQPDEGKGHPALRRAARQLLSQGGIGQAGGTARRGTGFAPIKSIVEHVLQAGIERPMALYWGRATATASIWTRWRKAGKNAGRIQVCAGIVRYACRRGLARPHRSGSSGGDGRSARSVRTSGLCLRCAGHD